PAPVKQMTRSHSKTRNQKGYLLLSVMLLIAIMLLMLSIEAPRMAQQIKREKENELIHRGKEYAKAVRKYVRKTGNYPTSLEQLEDTNHIRFLRKRYEDPITGKADWKLIHQGEAEIKIPQNNNNSTLQGTNPVFPALAAPQLLRRHNWAHPADRDRAADSDRATLVLASQPQISGTINSLVAAALSGSPAQAKRAASTSSMETANMTSGYSSTMQSWNRPRPH